MWIGSAMYFVSDRTNGVANLYAQDLVTKKVEQITAYADLDVMMPSTDGTSIVFLYDGYLHVMNLASGNIARVKTVIPSDRWIKRPRTIDARAYMHAADAASDGKSLVLEARGDLFGVQIDKKLSINLSRTPGTREMHPALSPDGQTVAFFSDRTGEYQLHLQSANGGEWTPLTTSLDRAVYRIVWSPDGSKLLFGYKDFTLFVLDVRTKKFVTIDSSNQLKNDEFYWEIADYGWSPDSKWVTYSLVQFNRNSQIFVYSLEQAKRYPVTDDFFDNLSPRFDAGGKYLYYLSSRDFSVQMDFYEDNHVLHSPYQVMAVQLAAGEKPPFADSVRKSAKPTTGPFRIDTDGLQQRTFPLPVSSGNYFFLQAAKGKVLWCAIPRYTDSENREIFEPGNASKWELHLFDMDQKKESVISDKIREFRLSTNGEHLLVRRDDDLYLTSVEQAFQSKSPAKRWHGVSMRSTHRRNGTIFSDTGAIPGFLLRQHARPGLKKIRPTRSYRCALIQRRPTALPAMVASLHSIPMSAGATGGLTTPTTPLYGLAVRPESDARTALSFHEDLWPD
jgi:tricorn protease